MAATRNHAVVSPILVGRAAHLASLLQMLDEASRGRGQTVLLAGEAGIGKSRLVAEARARAAEREFLTLEGQCFEPDRALPFAPLIDGLRSHVAGQPIGSLPRLLGPAAPELVKLLPELATLIPDLTPTALLDPEQEKRRLFHVLSRFLLGLSATRPLLLIVEDLHWSDDTSLEFLLHLCRRIATSPLLVLLTYRPEDADTRLNHFLAELDRNRAAPELVLSRLDADETGSMVRAIFGLDRPIRAEIVRVVAELTEGNPFFIEEVLSSSIVAGDTTDFTATLERVSLVEQQIPRSIRDAVQRRAARISPAARQVLDLAAVAGRRFDFTLLQALTGRNEHSLLRLIKEQIDAQLVVETSAEHFAFRHALTRQAIYAELLARERRMLHRRVVGALERLHAGALDLHVEDLAYHADAAGDWEKTLVYATRAAERARALDASRLVGEQLTRVLVAASRLGLPASADVYRGRGLAYETLGDFDRARLDLDAALTTARAAGHRDAEWQALIDLGRLWSSRNYDRAGTLFEQALSLAREMGHRATIAHSLNWLGNWQMNVERPLEGQSSHEEALNIFRDLDDRAGMAETLDFLGVAANVSGDLVQSGSWHRQAVVFFRDMDDRRRLSSCLAVLATRGMSYVADTTITDDGADEPVQEAELALRLAREIDWRAGEAYALCVLADCHTARGDYDRALVRTRESIAIAEEIEHGEWLAATNCGFGALLRDMLVYDDARRYLDHALCLARDIGSPHWGHLVAGLLASTLVAAGDLTAAASLLETELSPDTPPQTMGQRLCWLARAELAFVEGDARRALTIADQIIASVPARAPEWVIPRLWLLRGDALAAMGEHGAAERLLQAATDTARTQHRKPLLWRIHLSTGRLALARGRRDDAERAVTEARTIIEELAALIHEDDSREDFRRRASALLPTIPTLSPRQAAKRASGGLTSRERDVVRLIARGKTNRAIAADLYLSERTVEGHVTNILTKLDFTSRAQIAAWSIERGVATADNGVASAS